LLGISASGGGARLVLFGLTAAAYACSLTSPFQFDDRGVTLQADAVHSLGALLDDLGGGLRPVLKASYALCWAFGGVSWPFHVFNLLLHLVNVELVLRLAVAGAEPTSRGPFALTATSSPLALVSGTLFALHPIQTEAVSYVSGRSSSLATAFVLLALLFHIHGVRTADRRYRLFAAPFAFALAILTKETSAVLPLGLLLWDALIERATLRELLRRQLPWCAAGAATLLFLLWHPGYYNLLYRVVGQRALADSLWYQLGGMRYLAAQLSFVERPCIDPGLWLGPSRVAALAGGGVVLALAGLALWQRRERPLVSFGAAWFLLYAFVPYVLLPRVDVINERHAYLANAGLFLALGTVWQEWFATRRQKFSRAAAALASAGLFVLTVRRNVEYQSEVSLWESTVSAAPKNPRAFNNLGVAYEKAGRIGDARSAYRHALVLEPRYSAARKNLNRVGAAR